METPNRYSAGIFDHLGAIINVPGGTSFRINRRPNQVFVRHSPANSHRLPDQGAAIPAYPALSDPFHGTRVSMPSL